MTFQKEILYASRGFLIGFFLEVALKYYLKKNPDIFNEDKKNRKTSSRPKNGKPAKPNGLRNVKNFRGGTTTEVIAILKGVEFLSNVLPLLGSVMGFICSNEPTPRSR